MSLSPPYADRIRIPHQPAPPAHWPEDCAEVYGHSWLRIFQCPVCKRGYEFKPEEFDQDGVSCFGDGVVFFRAEPRR